MYAWKTIPRPWQHSAVGTVGHPSFPDQVSASLGGDDALGLKGAGDTPETNSGGDGAGATKEDATINQDEPVKQEPTTLSKQQLDQMTAKCLQARQGLPATGQYDQSPKKRSVSPTEQPTNKASKKMKSEGWDLN